MIELMRYLSNPHGLQVGVVVTNVERRGILLANVHREVAVVEVSPPSTFNFLLTLPKGGLLL